MAIGEWRRRCRTLLLVTVLFPSDPASPFLLLLLAESRRRHQRRAKRPQAKRLRPVSRGRFITHQSLAFPLHVLDQLEQTLHVRVFVLFHITAHVAVGILILEHRRTGQLNRIENILLTKPNLAQQTNANGLQIGKVLDVFGFFWIVPSRVRQVLVKFKSDRFVLESLIDVVQKCLNLQFESGEGGGMQSMIL